MEPNVDAKCEPCSSILPGCAECGITNSAPRYATSVMIKEENVRDDNDIEPAEYVYCKKPSKGLYPYRRNGVTTYRRCAEIIKGCKDEACWDDGTSCHHCEDDWYFIYNNGRGSGG